MTTKSNGPLKDLAEIKQYARELRNYASPNDRRKQDMATLALRNPEVFLARPQWQEELILAAGDELD